ncbi:hypothetical protein NDU88_001702 [Pleurodeles waltl]|uniref:Uncharacterized protein n=1 Tax=Pleurodeles waltl TaxID=8319 RepID=A0AAV7P8R1_PLEWA|nr:hypothetical protein NDU88_001702 [Pleurodeles waltl]
MARLPTSEINRPALPRRPRPATVVQRRPSAPLEALALRAGSGPVPLSPSPAGPLFDRPGGTQSLFCLNRRLHGRDRPTGTPRPHGSSPRPHPRPRLYVAE